MSSAHRTRGNIKCIARSRLRCLSLAHLRLPRLEISNATAVRVKLTSPVKQRLNVVSSPLWDSKDPQDYIISQRETICVTRSQGTNQHNVLLRILPNGANSIKRSTGYYSNSEFVMVIYIQRSGRQMTTVNNSYILSSTFTCQFGDAFCS